MLLSFVFFAVCTNKWFVINSLFSLFSPFASLFLWKWKQIAKKIDRQKGEKNKHVLTNGKSISKYAIINEYDGLLVDKLLKCRIAFFFFLVIASMKLFLIGAHKSCFTFFFALLWSRLNLMLFTIFFLSRCYFNDFRSTLKIFILSSSLSLHFLQFKSAFHLLAAFQCGGFSFYSFIS